MEPGEEAMAATANNSSSSIDNSEYSHAVVKGKRTKRQRLSQLAAPAASSTTSSSGEFSGSATEEEEDMANCLILLAQGRALDARALKSDPAQLDQDDGGGGGGGERVTSRRFAEAATTTNGKAGFYVYECKTCNKCFPSFQALGGHRSSHKKPKTALAAMAVPPTEEKAEMDEESLQISIASIPNIPPSSNTATINALNNNNNNNSINSNKSRVHECSICGSEFSSGQALGGHMRRHRTAATPAEARQEVKKEKSILSLDLNLPAPADDERGDFPKSPSFAFAGNQPLLFSASAALVDCHY